MPVTKNRMSINCLLVLIGAASSLLVAAEEGQQQDKAQRQQIGTSLGKPVYRDQIQTGKHVSLTGELHRLFTIPAKQKYCQAHQAALTPSPEEIALASNFFDKLHQERIKDKVQALKAELSSIQSKLADGTVTKEEQEHLSIRQMTITAQLKPPGASVAKWILDSWKFQRHLHTNYGGGRLLFQQGGTEAFDATRRWLEHLEKTGAFTIADKDLRKAFYHYWTTQKHGSFLIEGKDDILAFLHPEWLTKQDPQAEPPAKD